GGIEAMGLDLHVDEQYSLPQLTSVIVPEGINEEEIRTELLQDYSLEIGAGLGDLNGKIWSIGLMVNSCQTNNVITVLTLLEQLLSDREASIQKRAAVYVATKMIKQSSFAK